jgi:hypothetical protein
MGARRVTDFDKVIEDRVVFVGDEGYFVAEMDTGIAAITSLRLRGPSAARGMRSPTCTTRFLNSQH